MEPAVGFEPTTSGLQNRCRLYFNPVCISCLYIYLDYFIFIMLFTRYLQIYSSSDTKRPPHLTTDTLSVSIVSADETLTNLQLSHESCASTPAPF